MNKSLLTILFLLLFCLPVEAQQVPFYNHNLLNPFVFNPSMAGASGNVNAFLVRNQRYSAFNGASVNNYLSIDGSFLKDKGGFGFQVAHQAYGIQQQLSSALTYAYRIRFRNASDLRFGCTAGLVDNRIDLSAINVMDQDDPYIATMRSKVSTFDVNAGLSYSLNSLRIGFAVPQLIGNKVAYDKENSRGYYRLARHMMFSGEYDFHFSGNKAVVLRPNAIVRYVPGAPLQYDLTAFVSHSKIGWASVGYKSGYSIQMNIGFSVMQQFKVGYSYEYLIGAMKNYSTGAHHEIMLGFTFPSKNKETIIEKEKIVEVPVDNPATKQENEELNNKNKELEELLQKTLAEKEELEKENAKLEEEKAAAQKAITDRVIPNDSVVKPANGSTPNKPKEELPLAKGYKLIELDLTTSPDGFYVVSGVFSSKANAESSLKAKQKYFPQSYLVINEKNGYYYIVVLYTLSQDEAVETGRRFERIVKKDAWVLNYKSDK